MTEDLQCPVTKVTDQTCDLSVLLTQTVLVLESGPVPTNPTLYPLRTNRGTNTKKRFMSLDFKTGLQTEVDV